MKKKIVFIAPHLSTGGMPQYLVKQIESIKDDMDVYCIEWENVTGGVLVVQRNKMVNLLGDRLITLGENKNELFSILNTINPDVVHLQEIPELFMPKDIADTLYSTNRKYILIETSHDSGYNVDNKLYLPDKFLMVSQYQIDLYKKLDIPCDLVEYPIESKVRTKTREAALLALGLDPNLKHVINVGLFTPRKNQAEVMEYARVLQHYPIQFHFIGNQAENFKHYWEPLMQNFPKNCKWWGERTDVDSFYEAADLFLFTSQGHATDMETMPLVIREALGWKVPSLIYNLPVYQGYFDKYDTIEYLTESTRQNAYRIAEKLLRENTSVHINENVFYGEQMKFTCDLNTQEQKVYYTAQQTTLVPVTVSVKDIDSGAVIWATKHDTLASGVSYWILPTPKHVLDFETNTTFGGILVEFYMNGELVQSNKFRLRTATVDKPKLKLINNVHPNYNNYVEFFVDKIYDKYLKGNTYNTVVDLGANIGVWTEYIRHVSNVGKVYMVEPNRMALELLRKCFVDENTVIVDKAVSDTNGHLDFYINNDNSLISSLANYSDLNTSYKVETITFRKLMEDYEISHINLIKIDIETGEYALFDSLTSDDFSKIDNIIMEFHAIAGRTYEKDVQPLLDKLENNGYTIEVVPLHAVGGFIFATKQHNDKNKKLTEILDNTPCPDKRDLAGLVNQLYPNGTGVEIGVLRGEYSKLILERWHNGTLYLIDTWRHLSEYIDMNGQDDQYHYECMVKTAENIKPWQHRAHMLRMDSILSADMFPDEHFDFIYIDADHSYNGVVKDIEAWWPKIKKGGLFCGDDYIPDNGDIWLLVDGKQTYAGKFGVRQAVTEFSVKHNLKIYETTNEPYWKQWYTFKPY